MVLWESYEVNQDLLHSTRYYDGLDVRLTSELSPQVCHDDICYQFRFYILIWLFYIWSVFPVILYTSSSWRIEQGQRPNGIFYFHKIQRYFCHWDQKQKTKSNTHNFININLFILLYCFVRSFKAFLTLEFCRIVQIQAQLMKTMQSWLFHPA